MPTPPPVKTFITSRSPSLNSGGGGGGTTTVTYRSATVPGAVITDSDLKGDFLSVHEFGAVGDGIANDQLAFQSAADYAKTIGGASIYVPKGTYLFGGGASLKLDATYKNITFWGEGASSVIVRGSNMPTGQGLLDLSGAGLFFRLLTFDGNQTTSIQLDWSTITDPMQANLVLNSTVWVHGGASNWGFDHCTFTHTAGYAILLAALSVGDIDGWDISDCLFINNRAHTFGTGGTNTYQSWTSGIHYQGDGTTYAVKNGRIHDNEFKRSPGSQIWGHLYAFTRLHENISVDHCLFEDVGLEGVEHGGLNGGGVTNCRFHRVGFITGNSDTATATPVWLANHQSTALDTSGLCTNLVYANNTFLNCNGGMLDMDGFGQGTVLGNTGVISQPGDPEYSEDQVSSFGPGGAGAQYCYGINCDNTSGQSLGGASNVIADNFLSKFGGGAIRLYACRNCKISGNNVNHLASGYLAPPIIYGPVAAGANYRAQSNTINNNTLNWNPSTMQAAIVEDPSLTTFLSTDKNWVAGNEWLLGSNTYEFEKDPNSGSVSRVIFSSTASGLTASSENWLQRETNLLRVYKNLGGTSTSLLTLQDAGTYASFPLTPGPLLNITNGSGNGGTITTGARTTSAFDDALLSGKGYFDSIICLADTTYFDSDANLLGPTVAMLRFKHTVGYIEQSIAATGAGPYVRTWIPLTLSLTGIANKDVLYSVGGTSIGGSSNFIWTNTAPQALTIIGVSGNPGLNVINSYIGADGGFAVTSPTLGNSYQSIQSPTGGVFCAGIGVTSGSGKGGYIDIPPLSYGGLTPYPVPLTSATFGGTDVLLFSSAVNGTGLGGNPAPLTTVALCTNAFMNAAGGFYTVQAVDTAIQAPNGGVTGRRVISTYDIVGVGVTLGFPPPAAGQGKLYFDSSTSPGRWMVTQGTNAAVPMIGASLVGTDQEVIYNVSGTAFAGSPNLKFNYTAQALVVTGITSTAGLSVLNGYIASDGGFTTISTNYQAIQAPAGGFLGAGIGITSGSGKGGYIDVPPISYGGLTPYPVPLASASFGSTDVLLFSASVNGTGLGGNPAPLTSVALCTNAFVNAAGGFYTAQAADTAIQAPNGGVSGHRIISTYDIVGVGVASSFPASAAGQGKLYFDSSSSPGKWMVTQGTNAAVPMLGASLVGTDQEVIYNVSGAAFAGSLNLKFNYTAQALNITGISSTAGLTVLNAYASADGGFVTSNVSYQAIQAPSGGFFGAGAGITSGSGKGGYIDLPPLTYGGLTPYPVALSSASFGSTDVLLFAAAVNGTPTPLTTVALCTNAFVNAAGGFYTAQAVDTAIQAPNGGITAHRHISTYDIVGVGVSSSFPPPAAGQGKLYFDSSSSPGRWMVTQGTNAAVPMLSSSLAAGSVNQVQYCGVSNAFAASPNLTFSNNPGIQNLLTVFGISGTAGIAVGAGYVQSDGGYLVTNTNTLWNTVQTSGGAKIGNALQLGPMILSDQGSIGNNFLIQGAAVGVVSYVVDAYDNTGFVPTVPAIVGRRIVASSTAGPWSQTPSGAGLFTFGGRGSYSGSPGGVTASNSAAITFAASENWTSASNNGAEIQFATTPNANGPGARATRVYIRNTGTLEIMNGMYAHFGMQSDGFISFLPTVSTPSIPSSGYAALVPNSGSVWWYYNPSTLTWNTVNFAASSGGVTFINLLNGSVGIVQGTGVTVTTSSPNITISIGQPVNTTANVTFQSMQSQNTGASITFQNTNFNFQVDGNGNISAAGSVNVTTSASTYKLQGAVMINTAGQFVGPGVNVGRFNGVGARAFNPYDSGGTQHFGADFTFQDATLATHTVIGGVLVS